MKCLAALAFPLLSPIFASDATREGAAQTRPSTRMQFAAPATVCH